MVDDLTLQKQKAIALANARARQAEMEGAPGTASGGGWGDTLGAVGSNALAGAKLAGRTAARVGLAPFDLMTTGMKALGSEFDKTGLTAPQPTLVDRDGTTPIGGANAPSPSEQFISDTGMTMDPDASGAMKAADFVAPLLTPTGPARIAESPTVLAKLGTYGRQVAGTGIDAALSAGGGEIAKEAGADDLGQLISSFGGGTVRPLVARGAGELMKSAYGSSLGGAIFDAAQRLGVLPSFGMVANAAGKNVEKGLGATPIVGRGVDAARERNNAAAESGLATATGQIAGGPGAAPLPSGARPDEIGQPVVNTAQGNQTGLIDANSARQGALEQAVGPNTDVDVSPLMALMRQVAVDPTTGPASSRAIAPRTADLQTLVQRQNPPLTGQAAVDHLIQNGGTPEQWRELTTTGQISNPAQTAAYGGLKDWRTDLGQRSLSADPVPGQHLGGIYGAATDAMRGAAADQGHGAEFDAANEAYRRMNQDQLPFLQKFGGEQRTTAGGGTVFDGAPSAGSVAGRVGTAMTVDPATMTGMREHIGDDTTAGAVANIIRNYGVTPDGDFRVENFPREMAKVNPPTRDLIASRSPSVPQILADVSTVGSAFNLRPEQPGLTKAVGGQLLLNRLLSGSGQVGRLGALGSIVSGLESPDMVRAIAGRTDIPALLAQYALRAGLINQAANRGGP